MQLQRTKHLGFRDSFLAVIFWGIPFSVWYLGTPSSLTAASQDLSEALHSEGFSEAVVPRPGAQARPFLLAFCWPVSIHRLSGLMRLLGFRSSAARIGRKEELPAALSDPLPWILDV